MQVVIITEHLPDYKLELLNADLLHLQKSIKYETIVTLGKLKNDKSAQARLMNILKKIQPDAVIGEQLLKTRIELLSQMDLVSYSLQPHGDGLKINMSIDNNYFDLQDTVTKFLGRLMGFSRKGLVDKVHKILDSEYNIKNYKVEVDGEQLFTRGFL